MRKAKDFFFLYYEGQRDSGGKTQAAIGRQRPNARAIFRDLPIPQPANPRR